MKNNQGLGLYEIGEVYSIPCGCIGKAEKIGYSHFVNPECKFDNKYFAPSEGYKYFSWEKRPNQ